jgi:hypothetical protein
MTFDPTAAYKIAPPRGGAHLPKFLLWEPVSQPSKTAMLPNKTDGMQRMVQFVNQTFGRQCIRVLLSRDYQYLPECCFEFFGRHGQHRMVEVFKDSRWEFRTEGDPLECEMLPSYEFAAIRKRLTPAAVAEYLSALGWDISQDSFWRATTEAVMARQLHWGPDVGLLDLISG